MRIFFVAVLAATIHEAIFEKQSAFSQGHRDKRQTSADQMVQNILQWLQGVYTQNSRRIRQGTLREYLPPSNTQKPRPFETAGPSTSLPTTGGGVTGGYPPVGSITPRPPFPTYPSTGGYPSPHNEISPPEAGGYPGSVQPQPPFTEGESSTSGYHPTAVTGYPSQRPDFPTGPQSTGYPSQTPGYPTSPPSTGYPSQKPGFPTGRPPTGSTTTEDYYTQEYTTEYSSQRPSYTTDRPQTQSPTTKPPTSTMYSTEPFTSPISTTQHAGPSESTQSPDDNNVIPSEKPDNEPKNTVDSETVTSAPSDEDLKHPPHIHEIDVECAKDMMTINIEFNREFNGVIYSKGYYNTPECRYVNENSEQTKYTFTVSLNSCGTEFINAFDTQGQSYLENVLVLQNEPGIQEVWDTIRSVRCLWEGNLKESLSVALSVGMLSQEIVTFSGDTAMAKLDIQVGRGPFAQPANGLVKIGETMTLVVSVSGDPGFDVQVKDCRATDSTGDHIVPLTDDNGCVLKPKLFGAFQKSRNAGNTGASIIAYAFFSAFKFPDVMDLMIECNIELCKTDCQVCPNPNQKTEPGRRKRDLSYYNQTLGDNAITIGRHLRVILPEDLSEPHRTTISLDQDGGVCMTAQCFVFSSAIMISILTSSCLFSAYLWFRLQQLKYKS